MSHYRLKSGNESWLTSYADLITNLLIFFILIISVSQVQTGKLEKMIQEFDPDAETQSLSEAEKKVVEKLREQHLLSEVNVKMTDEGLEISFNSGVMFASGSADILTNMEEKLAAVLAVVKPYTARYHVAIEGHTDEVPMRSERYKSNWELSSARAMQIRERLESSGIDGKQIRVEAYADKKPLSDKEIATLSKEDQRARLRRVVIRLF